MTTELMYVIFVKQETGSIKKMHDVLWSCDLCKLVGKILKAKYLSHMS